MSFRAGATLAPAHFSQCSRVPLSKKAIWKDFAGDKRCVGRGRGGVLTYRFTPIPFPPTFFGGTPGRNSPFGILGLFFGAGFFSKVRTRYG